MTDSKFDFQKIIGDVKSMISPVAIPEANKDDAVGYCLSELSKLAKNLADSHAQQADTITKISSMLGTLHQEIQKKKGLCGGSAEKPQEPVAEADVKEEEKPQK